MTLKRFMSQAEKVYGTIGPEWARVLVQDAYAEGKKEGKAQENRRLHRMHQKWQKTLDKTDGENR